MPIQLVKMPKGKRLALTPERAAAGRTQFQYPYKLDKVVQGLDDDPPVIDQRRLPDQRDGGDYSPICHVAPCQLALSDDDMESDDDADDEVETDGEAGTDGDGDTDDDVDGDSEFDSEFESASDTDEEMSKAEN